MAQYLLGRKSRFEESKPSVRQQAKHILRPTSSTGQGIDLSSGGLSIARVECAEVKTIPLIFNET